MYIKNKALANHDHGRAVTLSKLVWDASAKTSNEFLEFTFSFINEITAQKFLAGRQIAKLLSRYIKLNEKSLMDKGVPLTISVV